MGVYNVSSSKTRITAIAGHYGSGKSEISVNYALFLALKLKEKAAEAGEEPKQITLFDLDIVNPYFRSRECQDLLAASRVRVTSSAEAFPDVDLPYMPPELSALFQDKTQIDVLDIGGDPAGARVLARYGVELNKVIKVGEAEFWCVINANRPMTKTREEARFYVQKISDTAGVPVTGLIGNTHLFWKTEPEDIYRGAELVQEVSSDMGIPVIFHAVERKLADDILKAEEKGTAPKVLEAPIFPMDISLKKPWER